MGKYNIEIKETLVREIAIEATSIDEAMDSVELLYNSEGIVLDYNDHNTTDIDLSNLAPYSSDSDFLNFVLLKAQKSIVNLSAEELAKIGFGNLNEAIKEYLRG